MKKCISALTVITLIALLTTINISYSMVRQLTIHDAAQHGDLESLTRLLVVECISVNQRNQLGQTPLMCAIVYGQARIVDALIHTYNAQLELTDNKGQTALHYAALKGHDTTKFRKYITHALLKHNANTDTQSAIGFTPLHAAVISNQEDIALLLLAFGADKEITDNAGLKPYHYARAKKNGKLAQYLSLDIETTPKQPLAGKAALEHTDDSASPWEIRLQRARAMLLAHKKVNAEEEDAQEDQSSD